MLLLSVKSLTREGATSRAFGNDSPVTAALFTRTLNASIKLQSAGILEPCSRFMISSGTKLATGTWIALPSLSACACCGSRFCNAASVCSARYSCQSENLLLTRIKPMMATPKLPVPCPGSFHSARADSTAATQSRSQKNRALNGLASHLHRIKRGSRPLSAQRSK